MLTELASPPAAHVLSGLLHLTDSELASPRAVQCPLVHSPFLSIPTIFTGSEGRNAPLAIPVSHWLLLSLHQPLQQSPVRNRPPYALGPSVRESEEAGDYLPLNGECLRTICPFSV
jgi:hypothetical protein